MDAVGFMSLLISHFPFKHKTPEAETLWMQSFYRQLKVFSPKVLERACNDIIMLAGKRDRRRFPSLAECVEACTEAKRWLEAETHKGELIKTPEVSHHLGYSEDRKDFANTLIRGELGRQAVKEGWQVTLRDFARQHGRLPKPGPEINSCKQGARDFDWGWAEILAGRGGVLEEPLRKLGMSMLQRRDEVAKWITEGR